jgi:ankyrin repeat protein
LNINALNSSNESAIFVAIRRKEPDIAKMMLESRSDLDHDLEYDISSLAECEADTFLHDVPEADQRGFHRWTIFHLAARLGYTGVLKLLIDKFKDSLNVHARLAQGDTALHCAVTGASLEALQILLDETKIGIDAINEDGITALHMAAEIGDLDATRLLLEHGADMDIAEIGGSTAEQLATSSGYNEVAQLLRSSRRKHSMSLGEAG